VSQVLEVKKTSDGKVFAKRKDGLPLTLEDREAVKKLALESPPRCYNCGEATTETKDIYGETVFVCWSCAKWA
jgi:formylmethanofuran dehydrogenase subunit E